MPEPRIAIATCAAYADLKVDDELLRVALEERGCEAESVIWDQLGTEWSQFDLCLVRSTWDYDEKHREFLDWTRRVDGADGLGREGLPPRPGADPCRHRLGGGGGQAGPRPRRAEPAAGERRRRLGGAGVDPPAPRRDGAAVPAGGGRARGAVADLPRGGAEPRGSQAPGGGRLPGAVDLGR